MTKFIVVAGGVISGVGKGVTTASLGKLFSEYGYSTTLIKIDPYLNYDAGTLRPTEHGEVWVTEDGGEIDQDLGTYERFLNQPMPKKNSITSGQIYYTVIERERHGGYLGETVQSIPHIPDEIAKRVKEASEGYDVAIIEIGGIVGDYENVPFLFALKALERELGEHSVAYVLVVYIPVPEHIQEMKTKPAQQAIKALNEQGIFPDIILCRANHEMDDIRKKKIEAYAHMPSGSVFSAPNVKTIYQIPLDLDRDQVGQKLLDRLNLVAKKMPDWSQWQHRVDTLLHAPITRTIAIVGKYLATGDYELEDSYVSVQHALLHAGVEHNVKIKIMWLNAQMFETDAAALLHLDAVDGIVVPGGFGVAGVEGKIRVIEYARKNNIPYLGLCYGMQLAAVEFARHVVGLEGANTTEVNPHTRYPIVDILPLQKEVLAQGAYGGTMRMGTYPARIKEGTLVHQLYAARQGHTSGPLIASERHRHRYEINPRYVKQLEEHGLVFSGVYEREDGSVLCEYLELPEHRFFVATQSHPEFTSRFGSANPLFFGLVGHACAYAQEKERALYHRSSTFRGMQKGL